MSNQQRNIPPSDAPPRDQSDLGTGLRFYWMLLGFLPLIYGFSLIIHTDGQGLSIGDLVYWASVVLLIAVRYIDIKHFHGLTGNLAPATMKNWMVYSGILVGFALIVRLAIPLFGLHL